MRFISKSRGQYLPVPTKSSNETPMSAFGTKRTSEADGSMSAFGGKADMTFLYFREGAAFGEKTTEQALN
jgi:hypothetical protein